jgi:transcriptional regulator with XRE-family HTH domain
MSIYLSRGVSDDFTPAARAARNLAMGEHTGENLRRVMAEQGLSFSDVVEQSGLDRRTISGILDGRNRPHPRTIHRLAKGLGVGPDEFFVSPTQLVYRRFDERTNPVVHEIVESRPDVFAGWSEADFDELHSRFGAGGCLTPEGVLAAAGEMNRRRELQEKFALLLESSQAGVVIGIVEVLYREVVLGGE